MHGIMYEKREHMDPEMLAQRFAIPGRVTGWEELFVGNINRTFAVTCAVDGEKPRKYIFQRINTFVFQQPDKVMTNILHVTEHIKRHLLETVGSYDRRVLSFMKTPEGTPYVDDPEWGFWRAYEYVDHARSYDVIHNPRHFYEAGRAFGDFQGSLADFPADSLYETIPDFHNTVKRMASLRRAVADDAAGRRDAVQGEIAFLLEREAAAGTIVHMLDAGEIPRRVTHNDTKINNILFDTENDEALCVIDLDTVMPGSSLYDFGDAVRSGASTAEEDEEDLRRVLFDLDLFERFTRGFVESTAGLLTARELDMLPDGARIITLELASRFLTDYLNGDRYFKTTRPDQNLYRARTQIKLVAEMEKAAPAMREIVADCRRQ